MLLGLFRNWDISAPEVRIRYSVQAILRVGLMPPPLEYSVFRRHVLLPEERALA